MGHNFKKFWGQVEKKEITQNDSFHYLRELNMYKGNLKSVDGYKLHSIIEFARDKVKQKAKQEIN